MALDLLDQQFGRLKVLARAPNKGRHTMWACKCSCGGSIVTATTRLRLGQTKSCGCFATESKRAKATTHGMSHTPTHRSWIAMRRRCNEPNSTQYKWYGARGITVCKRWEKFENFLADMGERPTGTTLDRINNDKNYSPANCRWAMQSEQVAKQGKTLRIEYQGETKTLREWARQMNVRVETLYGRYKRTGGINVTRSGYAGKLKYQELGSA